MIFFGIEKEGKYKGFKTLFVGGEHNIEEVQKLAIRHECEHIYLGAGRTYTHSLTEDDLVRLLSLNFKLSMEVAYKPDLSDNILSQIHVIYSILIGSHPLDVSWLLPCHTVKIEDKEKVMMLPVIHAICNDLDTLVDDNHYEEDVMLVK